jgi:RNA polymerase sigma-70 factor (ECF subfamily)
LQQAEAYYYSWLNTCKNEQVAALFASIAGAFMQSSSANVTVLLKQISSGNQDAIAELVPLLYGELRKMASGYLQRERPGHTLQPTALVHEAYLRLVDQKAVEWQNRSHFFGVAAQQMRRILVDYARAHHAAKRGGPLPKLSLDESLAIPEERSGDLLELDEALTVLASMDPQQVRIIELRFFAGLTVEETADLLKISPATVKREWTTAKAWLAREIQHNRDSSSRGKQTS